MLRKAIDGKIKQKNSHGKPRLLMLASMVDDENENAISKYSILKHKAQDRKKVAL